MSNLITQLNTSEQGSILLFFEKIKKNKVFSFLILFLVFTLFYFATDSFLEPAETKIDVESSTSGEGKGGTAYSQDDSEISEIFVDVSGAVEKPGMYKLESNSRVAEAIYKAGGIRSDSYSEWVSKNLNLSAVLHDQQKIYIPFEWDREPVDTKIAVFSDSNGSNTSGFSNSYVSSYISDTKSADGKNSNSGSKNDNFSTVADGGSSSSQCINVNSASEGDLKSLKGVGEIYATRIIENRTYANLEEFKNKSNLYSSLIENIKDSICFN